ncbi:MAG TPA: L-histidine N(alpha)-methyltransferase [Solimonas sp.]|nr:L-histidine N(alpha)-methyltransferase [Solimonas sp.]
MLDLVDERTRQLEAFREDVIAGLSGARKTLPSRWLYDDEGSQLFERITALPEYYPTRTETAILREHAGEMAVFCGPDAAVLEYGAGAGLKTEILLDALQTPRVYVPIDIAGDFLEQTATRMRPRFPDIEMRPVVADFTANFDLPRGIPKPHRLAFFPGSTIGNLDADESAAFLAQVRRHVGAHGALILGVDLRKDLDTLLAAYDDAQGVTAAFNLNLLARINRELDADFALDGFHHEARWNDAESAVEMHLVSACAQQASVSGCSVEFAAGETIHTESSRKYDIDGFASLAQTAGWQLQRSWTDAARRFAVLGLKPEV